MLTLFPVKVPTKKSKFDVVDLIEKFAAKKLRDGDVLVLSSKFVAMSEGRTVKLASVHPGKLARAMAVKYSMDPRLCELVIRESDEILGGIPGFILATKEGLLTPNAGIDKSNVQHGTVILYPRRPEASAKRIRKALKLSMGLSLGVVICDSRLSPTRRGTIGVAVAASGIQAIEDMRGRTDLFGNVLKVTAQALADDLSSAAEVLMGESDESVPMVIIRGVRRSLIKDIEYPGRMFAIPTNDDVFLRSLGPSGRA